MYVSICDLTTVLKRRENTDRIRDTETGDPERLPAQVAGRWGLKKMKKRLVRKVIFCTGLTRAAKAGQKSSTTSPTNQPRKDPFPMYSMSPHLTQFQL
jgi:hypothetical protein